ncbi:YihY/virulence factor BrkB family protein [uncultured Thermanaerothrix sp.]|uniref:YihY/virulence factor BrkB family protein n=1 Tax=uncultured Thermanaerothrix sp. TaxID=1195149 RepID=UPI00260C55AF|nr:YihY/virulence factor BrkB family protein [uncultured Thermanaerothrix sp.]
MPIELPRKHAHLAQFANQGYLKIRTLYRRANRLSRGSLHIIRLTVLRFSQARGAEAAASLSYYALFSLFPLLLILISVLGFVLRREDAYQITLNLVVELMPGAQSLIERTLQEVLSRRSTYGLIGLLGALWSATGFFNTLVRHINYAWQGVKPRDLLRTRLMALFIVLIIILLLILSLASTPLINLLRQSHLPVHNGVPLEQTLLWTALSTLVPWTFTFLMFLGLYAWIPNTSVRWRAVFSGALFAALGWEVAKRAFVFYLSSGWARYELIYGSLGTVVVFMIWMYVSSLITLLGAHLTATIDENGKLAP